MTKLYCVFIVCFFVVISVDAQKVVLLQKESKKIILPVGSRVKYVLKDGSPPAVGRIKAIQETTLTIGSRDINIDQFQMLGRKKGGSNFFGIFSVTLGAALISSGLGQASDSNDPCPSCQTVSETGQGWPIVSVVGGIVLTISGINTFVRNSTRDISEGWSIQIIEKPVKSNL